MERLLEPQSLMWIAIAVISIAPILGSFWYKAQKAKHEAELKQGMIDNGYSASEIERVLAAGSEGSKRPRSSESRRDEVGTEKG